MCIPEKYFFLQQYTHKYYFFILYKESRLVFFSFFTKKQGGNYEIHGNMAGSTRQERRCF